MSIGAYLQAGAYMLRKGGIQGGEDAGALMELYHDITSGKSWTIAFSDQYRPVIKRTLVLIAKGYADPAEAPQLDALLKSFS